MSKNKKYDYNDLKNNLKGRGFELLTKKDEYKNSRQKIIISNGKYKTYISAGRFLYKNKEIEPYWFSKNNPFIIDNINNYLLYDKNGNFVYLKNIKIEMSY